MPIISGNLFGADGPLFSLEINTGYETTYFPSDLVDTPYFIIFRAQKEYKLSELAKVQPKYINTVVSSEGYSPEGNIIESGTQTRSRVLQRGLGNLLLAGAKSIGDLAVRLEGSGINISLPAHSFALPLPSNLSTAYNVQYNNNAELGPLGVKAREVAANVSGGSGSLVNNLVDALKNANFNSSEVKGVAGNLAIGAVEGGAGTAFAAGLLSGLGPVGAAGAAALSTVGTGALVGLGVARNPHIANVFTGVNFRTHQFNYKLIAKNKKESDSIRKLIHNFKYHMAPDYNGSSHIFTYPSKFQIILKAGDHLFKIGDSVLTEFAVDYTGEGAPYFLKSQMRHIPFQLT
jgi:hypothetical protein